jgi:hypothetical protein
MYNEKKKGGYKNGESVFTGFKEEGNGVLG